MGGSTVVIGWGLAAALLILVGLAVAANAAGSLGLAGNVATAAVRAVVQLGVVSGIIVAVVRSLWLACGFVLVMFTIAVLTSGRRMTPGRSGLLAAVPIAAGTVPVTGRCPRRRCRAAHGDRGGAGERHRDRRSDDGDVGRGPAGPG